MRDAAVPVEFHGVETVVALFISSHGMIVTTFPWHYVGILGMPRRMAYFDYTNPALEPDSIFVSISVIGGLILLISGLLFIAILIKGLYTERVEAEPYRFSEAVHVPADVVPALNGFGVWAGLMIALTITNYGPPVATLLARSGTAVPAVYIGESK